MARSPFAVPEAQATASTEFLSLLALAGRFAGVSQDALLARAGLSVDALHKPRLPIEHVRRVFVALDELSRDPLLGLTVAVRLEVGGFDLLDYLVHNASTLREACEHYCRYMPLLADAGRVWLSEHGERAMLCHHADGALPIISQLMVGGIVSRARAITGGQVVLLSAGFMQGARAPAEEYARRLGGLPVHFGQVCDHVVFERKSLDLPLGRSDPRLSCILKRQAEQAIDQLSPEPPGRDDALREAARELVLSGHASLERLAERLSTTTRTLQRRLAEAGTTHRRLMDEVRADLVEGALARGEGDFGALARTLGYATPGSLRRARERWRGRAGRDAAE